ncbi:hypothetical protein DAEQUDRAFT_31073 [Daedalea quercina L-15889]|uniref:Uncharacterized protein n=1 Tax=Daedalea quercina L-15889 TaxID=1314783 RepID=A0A165SQ36_9APHY|nr:hypothetical protein DAEQUDRAFT_31073 [Daedalea quercina L-15889]
MGYLPEELPQNRRTRAVGHPCAYCVSLLWATTGAACQLLLFALGCGDDSGPRWTIRPWSLRVPTCASGSRCRPSVPSRTGLPGQLIGIPSILVLYSNSGLYGREYFWPYQAVHRFSHADLCCKKPMQALYLSSRPGD